MSAVKYFISVFCIYIFFGIVFSTPDYDVILERLENIKGLNEDLVNFSKLRFTRNGSDFLVNGNLTYYTDMDNSVSVAVSTAYSPSKNSRFIQSPFRMEEVPICVFYNTTHKKYIQPALTGIDTNFPIIPPEGLCPIPKGKYYGKDAVVTEENFPSHLPRGLWRLEKTFLRNKQLVGGWRAVFQISDKK